LRGAFFFERFDCRLFGEALFLFFLEILRLVLFVFAIV